MTLRAIAFHESISEKKLAELFRQDPAFATTDKTECSKCRARFAVFLPDRNDKSNGEYVDELAKRISGICKAPENPGHRNLEIRLDRTP